MRAQFRARRLRSTQHQRRFANRTRKVFLLAHLALALFARVDGVETVATILLGDRFSRASGIEGVACACYLLLTMGAAESRILAEALELSEDERLRIAEALLHSVAPDGVASVDDPGTAAELRRRVAEIEAGDRAGVSWAELKDTIERE